MKRISLLFVTIVFVVAYVLVGSTTRAAGHEEDEKAVENVVRAFEQAAQELDFDKANALLTPDARWIRNSYPRPFEPWLRSWFPRWRDARIRIDCHLHDVEVRVKGDVAWATLLVDSAWNADTEAARMMLGRNESRYFVVESEVLVRTPNGWRIALVHADSVPADFGSRPDLGQEHGGMKFADVVGGSPADKAGFKVGDVMIEFGGEKVDNPNDYDNVLSTHSVGDKVVVTVMRGQEKITKIVTLEGQK